MPGRSNGLQALAYTPLTELDPRLADTVLAALREANVAAYVVAAAAPSRPQDRLWVDATAVDRARSVLDATVAHEEPAPLDEDAVWRDIVAHFEEGPASPVPPWPVTEDVDESGGGRLLRRVESPPPPPTPPPSPARPASSLSPPSDARAPEPRPQPEDAEATDDHFEPPPPPPLPRPTPAVLWAWVALVAGVGILLAPLVLGWALDGWVAVVGVAGLVGGFVGLVARLGDDPRAGDGPDDGAVV